jgi:hypothetical protein
LYGAKSAALAEPAATIAAPANNFESTLFIAISISDKEVVIGTPQERPHN